eukprot:TRINITY_DN6906_c0_g1_i1.p1 TRINITY_DN6906_c0_g1~~TRINITY_DN6906_c0_g1_i1.p1  ORF type:complete len:239 (-),score=57.43 TRINITY_DN6906_c0_g1_i1:201-917(-)
MQDSPRPTGPKARSKLTTDMKLAQPSPFKSALTPDVSKSRQALGGIAGSNGATPQRSSPRVTPKKPSTPDEKLQRKIRDLQQALQVQGQMCMLQAESLEASEAECEELRAAKDQAVNALNDQVTELHQRVAAAEDLALHSSSACMSMQEDLEIAHGTVVAYEQAAKAHELGVQAAKELEQSAHEQMNESNVEEVSTAGGVSAERVVMVRSSRLWVAWAVLVLAWLCMAASHIQGPTLV